MAKKLFTTLSPTIRWIMLPFACVIASAIISLVLGFSFMMPLGINAPEEHPILYFFKDLLQSFLVGLAFVRGALYVAPSHTRIVMQVVRIIAVCLIAGSSLLIYENSLLDWQVALSMILMIIGVLIKLDDEKDMIESED